MKFCHLLETQEDARNRVLFLFYKHMKKQIKRLPAAGSASSDAMLSAERRFAETLVAQINALVSGRMQRQAELQAQLAALEGRLQACGGAGGHHPGNGLDERQDIYRDLVNFHGQALLLLHFSILAYTAIVKILKKHHKHTGVLLQAPHVREALTQPCWSTEVVTGLIGRAEARVRELQLHLSAHGPDDGEVAGPRRAHSGSASPGNNQVLLNTLAALANDEDSGEDSVMGDAPSDGEGDGGGGGTTDGDGSVCSNVAVGLSDHALGGATSGEGSAAGAGGSVSGAAAAAAQQQQQQQQGQGQQGQGHHHAQAAGSVSQEAENAVPNQELVQQMEAALRTWEYLQTHASTPSTVIRTP